MSFLPLLATPVTWALMCIETFYGPRIVAPMAIGGVGCSPLVFRLHHDQTGLRIAESGERLRGSFHYDDSGRLTGVSLHHCSLTNNDLKSISHINRLKSLYFHDLDFRGVDLEPFSSIGSLESLTFVRSRITDSQLTFMRTMSMLKYITISDCEVTGEFLLKIPNPRHIENLTLSEIKGLKGSNINKFLGVATGIKALVLGSNGLVNGDLTGLSSLNKCTYLSLSKNKAVTSELCGDIARAGAVTILDLSGTLVGDAGVGDLSQLGRLEILSLANTPMGDGLKDLAGLDKLKELDLANTRVGDKGLAGIARSRNIRDLNLSNTLITDHGMRELSGLRSLEILRLSNARVSDESVRTLTGLRKLARLDLSGTLIGDDIGQIVELGSITHLHLADTRVGDKGAEALSHCARLVTLDLSRTRVHDKGVAHFGQLGLLEDLNLAGTSIGNDGARAVGACPRLITLNLARTRIGDDALKQLQTDYLILSGTRITSRGILELVSQRDHPLWIDITDTGIKSVGKIKPVQEGDRTVLVAPFEP